MSGCIDPQYEKMLHAYELGMLSDEEREEFGKHLLECQACFDKVAEFQPSARLLLHDPQFKKEGAREPSPDSGKLRKWTSITRLLAAAALIVVASIPIYWYSRDRTELVEPVQELLLLPDRGAGGTTLDLSEGGTARIEFVVEDIEVGLAYSITIQSQNGTVIYEDKSFAEFDERGTGTVTVPMTDFQPGFYQLSVSLEEKRVAQYFLRVE